MRITPHTCNAQRFKLYSSSRSRSLSPLRPSRTTLAQRQSSCRSTRRSSHGLLAVPQPALLHYRCSLRLSHGTTSRRSQVRRPRYCILPLPQNTGISPDECLVLLPGLHNCLEHCHWFPVSSHPSTQAARLRPAGTPSSSQQLPYPHCTVMQPRQSTSC